MTSNLEGRGDGLELLTRAIADNLDQNLLVDVASLGSLTDGISIRLRVALLREKGRVGKVQGWALIH